MGAGSGWSGGRGDLGGRDANLLAGFVYRAAEGCERLGVSCPRILTGFEGEGRIFGFCCVCWVMHPINLVRVADGLSFNHSTSIRSVAIPPYAPGFSPAFQPSDSLADPTHRRNPKSQPPPRCAAGSSGQRPMSGVIDSVGACVGGRVGRVRIDHRVIATPHLLQ